MQFMKVNAWLLAIKYSIFSLKLVLSIPAAKLFDGIFLMKKLIWLWRINLCITLYAKIYSENLTKTFECNLENTD